MTRAGLVFLAALLAGPALAQTGSGRPAAAVLACGLLKGEAMRAATGAGTQWTISTPAGRTTETGALRSGPRFDCIDGKVLVVEFTSTAGHSFFEAYFPDGSNIGYGRQQIDKKGGRYILPVQAKARIAEPLRGLFDYHCKLSMPADPISAAARADCVN